MDDKLLDELISFLAPSAQPPLREKALEYVVGLSGTEEGLKSLEPRITNCVLALFDLTDDLNKTFREDVFKGLINLSSVEKAANKLSHQKEIVLKLLQIICDPTHTCADEGCMVLSNLTRNSGNCQQILNCLEDPNIRQTIDLAKLVEVFCTDGYNKSASLHSLGSVLANLTQLKEARKFVLDRDRCVVQRLLPYTQYMQSEVRRRGVVTALKNCCFETEHHEWLLSDSVDILPYLLLPLAGPEELDEDDMEGMPEDLQYLDEDKRREPDPVIRKLLIESIMKLCTTKVGRDIIKAKRAYIIMREYDKWEQNVQVKDVAYELIQLLIGDDPEDDIKDLDKINIPVEVQEKFEKLTKENPRIEDDEFYEGDS